MISVNRMHILKKDQRSSSTSYHWGQMGFIIYIITYLILNVNTVQSWTDALGQHYKSARLTSEFVTLPVMNASLSQTSSEVTANTEMQANNSLITMPTTTTSTMALDTDKMTSTNSPTSTTTINPSLLLVSRENLTSPPATMNITANNGENRLRWVDFGRPQGFPPRLPNIPGIPSGFRNPLATLQPSTIPPPIATTEASIENLMNANHNFNNNPFGSVMDEEMYLPSMNIRPYNVTRVEHIVAECSEEYMKVLVRFNGTFNGLIYSSGYVHDPNCIYVNGSGRNNYEFFIRLNQCGTLGRQEMYHPSMPGEARRRDQLMWNTLSIQYNPLIEEEFDEHFRLTCEYGSDFWKTVTFPSVNVEINTGSPVVFTINPPQCQMEIRRGFGIAGTRTTGPVNVGDPLTLLIHMKSDKVGFDILVKNCVAHNGAQQRMQLIDSNGCVTNDKLISPFRGTYNGDNGHQVSLFAYLKAFRFTGSLALYLECDIHMCHNRCPPQRCYWRNLSKRSVELESYNESLNGTGKPILSESISLHQALEVRHDQDDEVSSQKSRAEQINAEQLCLGSNGLFIISMLFICLLTISLGTSFSYCHRMRKINYLQQNLMQHYLYNNDKWAPSISYPSTSHQHPTSESAPSTIRSHTSTNFSDNRPFQQAYPGRFTRLY